MSLIVLSIFAAIVFVVRLVLRKASRGECLLMGFLLLHLVLIQAQIYLDIHAWAFDFRYHAPTYPLLFGWAAYPFVIVCRRYRALTFVGIVALAGLFVAMLCSDKAGKRMRQDGLAVYQRVGAEVRKDWQGPEREVRTSVGHEYRPSRRPSVAAPPGVAYFAKGRQIWGEWKGWWRHPIDRWDERPDYIFLSMYHEADPDFREPLKACESDEYELVTTIMERGISGRLFRRRTQENKRKGD